MGHAWNKNETQKELAVQSVSPMSLLLNIIKNCKRKSAGQITVCVEMEGVSRSHMVDLISYPV